jgi:epidermal growth factor receptor substrate 15
MISRIACLADTPPPPTDQNNLNLTADEKRYYGQLFQQADTDRLGVVTGEVAVRFFERTKVAPNVLGEIWQIADHENRGLLTKPGFCVAIRLIGHYQAGREPSAELAFRRESTQPPPLCLC